MQTFFTVFALLILSGCAVFGWLAYDSVRSCRAIEEHLRRSLALVAQLDADVQVLTAQVHKLRGKIYSLKPGEQEIEIAKPFTQGLVCENYKVAQRDGPNCEAAACSCEYCEAKRVERKEFRARAVPKTAQEKRDAIERGRH